MRLSYTLFGVFLFVTFAGLSVAGPITGPITITDTFSVSSACCLNANEQFLYNAPVNGADHTFFYSNGASTDLGLLEAGQFGAALLAMNNSAQFVISGQLGVNSEEQVSNGKAIPVQSWPSTFQPVGLNNADVLVGTDRQGSTPQAAIYANGKVTDLGAVSSSLNATFGGLINDGGTVVVSAQSSSSPVSPNYTYTWSNGTWTNIGSLGNNTYQYTQANAINKTGEIVGYSAPTYTPTISDQQAFAYLDGTMSALGTLGGTYSEAQAVNDSGDIVGFSILAGDDRDTAFLYENGAMIDLNTLLPAGSPWYLTDAIGIDDAGQILALGFDAGNSTDSTDAFLLQLPGQSVTPEPGSLVLTALGLVGGLTCIHRAHRRSRVLSDESI